MLNWEEGILFLSKYHVTFAYYVITQKLVIRFIINFLGIKAHICNQIFIFHRLKSWYSCNKSSGAVISPKQGKLTIPFWSVNVI